MSLVHLFLKTRNEEDRKAGPDYTLVDCEYTEGELTAATSYNGNVFLDNRKAPGTLAAWQEGQSLEIELALYDRLPVWPMPTSKKEARILQGKAPRSTSPSIIPIISTARS